MGVSLIALASLASCTDDVDGGRETGPAGQRLTFIVDMEGADARTRADGSGAATATQYLDPVEMQGKLGGKSVYLQAEETDGFPGDGQPLTRGTQITTASHMGAFAVSAYTDPTGTPDQMYNMKVENVSSIWTPTEIYNWPKGKKLNFYAWHPYGADRLDVSDKNTAGAPTLTYTVPETVEDQQDVMTAVKLNQPEVVGGVKLQFKHALSAVRFQSGSRLSQCTLHYVKLKGVKYKGTFQLGSTGWTLRNDTTSYTFNLGVDMDGTPDVPITAGDQTLILMPQAFEDENAELEVSMMVPNDGDFVFSAKLKDITDAWKPGKTYTYKISDNLSDVMDVDVTFFKGTDGADGNPYTAHNISANGDPYTIDITYPYPNNVTSITGRWAYEKTENGVTTYEEIEKDIDLNGKTTLDDLKTLCMNNTGEHDKAKKDATPIVFQVKITSRKKVKMPADPNTPDTRQEYYPTNDNDTWYTVWRGTMYPPNYVDATNKVIMSRKDAGKTTIAKAQDLQKTYYEVDENHPTYGKGKWDFPNGLKSAEMIHKSDLLCDMIDNLLPPGEDELYGEPVKAVQNGKAMRYQTNNFYSTVNYGFGVWNAWWMLRSKSNGANQRRYDYNYFLTYAVGGSDRGDAQLVLGRSNFSFGVRFQIQY